jgi:putative transcription antitermination factor YqgF
MARKQKNDYFELAKAQTAHCVEAAELLVQILDTFSYEKIEEYKTTMHAIEHRADQIHHDILHRLSAEFITPIDQEDILGLVQIVDNITDALDEVVMGFPRNMDGSEGPRAALYRDFARLLEERTGMEVHLWDERRTTIEAHQILHAGGKRMKQHKQTVDAVAASLILEGYLTRRRRES